jgi:hypothetical protein
MTLAERCDAVEDCYEFMLGYAAQGLPADSGPQVRDYLRRAVTALTGIAAACQTEGIAARFTSVLEHDAQSSLAALELVLDQPSISSQLIDNLNASIHLRALLTDLFLVDEILKLRALRR